MSKIVKFNAHGKCYDLSIIDQDNNRWITVQQLGEALGHSNLKKLVYDLIKACEIVEKRHYSNVKLLNPKGGRPDRLVLSYRGVIRVAMRSQGSRAKLFRDWAEEVLFKVMTTGSFGADERLEFARQDGAERMMEFVMNMQKIGMDTILIGRLILFRNHLMTQQEVARALQVSKRKVAQVESELKNFGIVFPAVNSRSRDMSLLRDLPIKLFRVGSPASRDAVRFLQ